MIKKVLFLLFLWFSLTIKTSFAYDLNMDRDFLEYKNSLIYNLDKVKLTKVDRGNIKITVSKSKKFFSFSNSNPNMCIINVEISEDITKNFLGLNFEQELLWSILHELGHCELGKDVFVNGIDWKNDLKKYSILNDKLIKEVEERMKEAKSKLKCSNCLLYLAKDTSLVVYHEIFADFFSIINYNNFNKNADELLSTLIKVRKEKYLKNKETNYKSFVGLENLKNENLETLNDFNMISYLTQLTFIKILENKI